ncbi:MAG: FecR family protein [Mangrovibacterium sp.]
MHNALKQQLEQLRSGTLTEEERKKVLALFHRTDKEYSLKDEIYQQLENFADVDTDQPESSTDFERLWKRIESERLKPISRVVKWNTVLYWSAAALVLGLIFGILIPQDLLHKNEKIFYTAIAPKGSVSEMILPDSTVIFLNAGSKIRYAAETNHKSREVFLEGEAWFEVEHLKKIPFIVHTGFYDICVMGTRFNVKAYHEDNEVTTTLESGTIKVQSAGSFRMEKDIVLEPGEQLIYKKQENSLTVNQVNTRVYSSWKDNKLTFINMSLRELIILLERKYGVEIMVSDPDILSYHYDGTLKNETIIEVLNILQETLPVDYVINDQKIRILKK